MFFSVGILFSCGLFAILIYGLKKLFDQFKRFTGLFEKLKAFKNALGFIGQGFGNFQGTVINKDEKEKEDTTPQVITPEERIAKTIRSETTGRNKVDIDLVKIYDSHCNQNLGTFVCSDNYLQSTEIVYSMCLDLQF